MGLLDKAEKVKAAKKVYPLRQELPGHLLARLQAKADGRSDEWPRYHKILIHAMDSAMLPFRSELVSIGEHRHWERFITRSDYAAWLQSIGEMSATWWICEGETVNHTEGNVLEKQRRSPGRPEDPDALANRMEELREDAIAAARVIGGNPQVQQVANYLHNHGWGYAFDTIKRSLRKTWWQPLKESQK